MFQISSRTASISLNETERPEVNDLISDFIERTGCTAETFKDLFLFLLKTEVNQENYVQSLEKKINEATENTEVKQFITPPDNEIDLQDFESKLNELKTKFDLPEATKFDLVSAAVKISLKDPQTIEVEKEIPIELKENQALLEFSTQEFNLLDEISKRRFAKRKTDELETLPVLCKKMILNDGVIFNLHGEFYTGF